MWFVVIGVLLTGLKLAGVAPVALWAWWMVLGPFALAAVWWWLADAFGFTRKAQEKKQQQRVEERRRRQMEALGMKASGPASAKAFEGPMTRPASTLIPDQLKPKKPTDGSGSST